jgi:rare lipoprotein A
MGALAAISVADTPVCAQSLLDALSGPASHVATEGSWPAKHLGLSDAWRTSITLSIVKPTPNPRPVLASLTAKPYGLRGPLIEVSAHVLSGVASYYGQGGELTAAGERFDPAAMTAAHPTLPFGTHVRVTRVDTGDSVVVRINDRGPFKPGRVIDLTQGAAENLRMTDVGLTEVRLEVLDR